MTLRSHLLKYEVVYVIDPKVGISTAGSKRGRPQEFDAKLQRVHLRTSTVMNRWGKRRRSIKAWKICFWLQAERIPGMGPATWWTMISQASERVAQQSEQQGFDYAVAAELE